MTQFEHQRQSRDRLVQVIADYLVIQRGVIELVFPRQVPHKKLLPHLLPQLPDRILHPLVLRRLPVLPRKPHDVQPVLHSDQLVVQLGHLLEERDGRIKPVVTSLQHPRSDLLVHIRALRILLPLQPQVLGQEEEVLVRGPDRMHLAHADKPAEVGWEDKVLYPRPVFHLNLRRFLLRRGGEDQVDLELRGESNHVVVRCRVVRVLASKVQILLLQSLHLPAPGKKPCVEANAEDGDLLKLRPPRFLWRLPVDTVCFLFDKPVSHMTTSDDHISPKQRIQRLKHHDLVFAVERGKLRVSDVGVLCFEFYLLTIAEDFKNRSARAAINKHGYGVHENTVEHQWLRVGKPMKANVIDVAVI
mmetsp:Transcript_33301/g.74622  ORF Transcript_33301/g.74622 Transcript_33301/m.74622 type:complete len:359 (-) Transcript_33301:649-1725(-)